MARNASKACRLSLVHRIVRLVGAGEVAHHQLQVQSRRRRRDPRLPRPRRATCPACDMPLSTCTATGKRRPSLRAAARQAASCSALLATAIRSGDGAIVLRAGGNAVQDVDVAAGRRSPAAAQFPRRHGRRRRCGSLPAAARRDLGGAETVAVGLDHGAAFSAVEPFAQPTVVLPDSAEIDGEDGACLVRGVHCGKRRACVRLAGEFSQSVRPKHAGRK